jgi:hypothetical protein
MRGAPLYVWAFVCLSLIIIAVFVHPLITGRNFESGADGTLETPILTSYEPTPAQKKEILNVEKTYDITRGKVSSFDLSVSNPFQGSTIVGLDLTIGGSFAKYMEVEALERIDARGEKIELSGSPGEVGLAYGETQKYKITTFVPQYVDRGTYFVDLEIHKGTVTYRDYPAVSTGTGETALEYKDITFEIIEKRTVAINVHTYSEDEAEAVYEESIENIGLMRNAGFLTGRAERLLDEARAEMSDSDYEAAVEKGIEISKIKEDAFSSRDEIEGLKALIRDAEDVRGLKVPETKELLSLAVAAFEREDYEMARLRVREGELVYASETRGKINYQKLILDNLVAVVLGTIALFVISIFTFRAGSLVLSGQRLKGLEVKDKNIKQLMKEVQESYYIQKRLGTASYQNAMAGFGKKLTENQSERARLKARRVGALWKRENLKSLKLERKNLEELIQETQDRYYNKKIISRSEYDRSMEQYLAMGADVEEAIAVLELRVIR